MLTPPAGSRGSTSVTVAEGAVEPVFLPVVLEACLESLALLLPVWGLAVVSPEVAAADPPVVEAGEPEGDAVSPDVAAAEGAWVADGEVESGGEGNVC